MAGGPSAGRRRVPTAVLLVALIMALAGCDFSSAVATPSTAVPIRILLFDGGFCPTARFPARLTFRIDSAAAEQVTAIDETATSHRAWWPEGFRGGTADDPVVRDPRGLIVARDGEVLAIPVDGFPNLHGYSVCNGGDQVGPAIWVQNRTISLSVGMPFS